MTDHDPVSFFPVVAHACRNSPGPWRIQPPSAEMPTWIVVDPGALPERDEGWKLHVSATTWASREVLTRALPVLLSERATFKVAASMQELDALNDGGGGILQIGKFITVYPRDDEHAVRLAQQLDDATRGLPGPPVPSDRPLSRGSLVHYRFGAFVESPTESLLSLMGTMTPSERGTHDRDRYRRAGDTDDPFVAAGLTSHSSERVVAGRYVVMSRLHTSARGTIELAVDLDDGRRCILKRAWKHGRAQLDGSDARDLLRTESHVLDILRDDPRFPCVYDVVDDEGDTILAMEYISGVPVGIRAQQAQSAGRSASDEQVVLWGREVANMLGTIHARGFVYRDLSSMNVIVSQRGLRLIDFELASPVGSPNEAWVAATPGYSSPQVLDGHPADPADDIFSLGAFLYLVATNAEPGGAVTSLLDRPVRLLNPKIGRGVERVIERCLETDPGRRWSSTQEVEDALADAATARQTSTPVAIAGGVIDADRYAGYARRLGDTIRDVAVEKDDGPQWVMNGPLGPSLEYRDLSIGRAGTILALAEVVDAFRDPSHADILDRAATSLASTEIVPMPGLYVGEAGLAVALLRAAQVLDRNDLVVAALTRGHEVAKMPYGPTELFLGSAGRLRAHLVLWNETSDPNQLAAARACGEHILASARVDDDGTTDWIDPDPGAEPVAYLGYAHGVAGIGDALLDLYDVTSDGRYLECVHGSLATLEATAVRTLDDGSGLDWPRSAGDPLFAPLWCHGAGGIGTFFLHAATRGVADSALEHAAAAARMVAVAGRTLGPTQCHGLAGSIEFLIDMFQATGDDDYLREANTCARILEAFAFERDGKQVWCGDSPSEVDPGYLTGYGGVAVALLRIADPSRPRHLTRAGLSPSRAAR